MSAEKDVPLSRDARLDYMIEDAERAAGPCLDCEVGEPHMCRVLPPATTAQLQTRREGEETK